MSTLELRGVLRYDRRAAKTESRESSSRLTTVDQSSVKLQRANAQRNVVSGVRRKSQKLIYDAFR